ncbi:hypothetical protein ETW23_07780 [Leisingera sp. NJS201]|uniref:hypothetical protein n=1 Tax=Leisingera sp. NJS201 TaxID=2508306 RepID=UPI0010707F31|nr:hypothetical protein [Leisingera sp. NJS201]QBR36053.1 hypothetical protein ETW23_07780 [Leisingera sp. NJS201]
MSDFHFHVGVHRDAVAFELTEDTEQLAYVLGVIAERTRTEDILEFDHMIKDRQKTGTFLRALADHLDPTGA